MENLTQYIEKIMRFIEPYSEVIVWTSTISVLAFMGTLVSVPFIISRQARPEAGFCDNKKFRGNGIFNCRLCHAFYTGSGLDYHGNRLQHDGLYQQ